MILTIEKLIESEIVNLNNWEKGLEKIKNGTFKYDGSMPVSCVNALYRHKVKVYQDVIDYLKNFPMNKVIYDSNDRGYGEIYDTYLSLCNR